MNIFNCEQIIYRKRSKNKISRQRKFIWTTCYEINDAR